MGVIFQPRALSAVPVVKGPSVSIKLKAWLDLEKRELFCFCLGYTTMGRELGVGGGEFVKPFKRKY